MYETISRSTVLDNCRASKTCSTAVQGVRPMNSRYRVQPVDYGFESVLNHKRNRSEGADEYELNNLYDEKAYSTQEFGEKEQKQAELNSIKVDVNNESIGTEKGVTDLLIDTLKKIAEIDGTDSDIKVASGGSSDLLKNNLKVDANPGKSENKIEMDIKNSSNTLGNSDNNLIDNKDTVEKKDEENLDKDMNQDKKEGEEGAENKENDQENAEVESQNKPEESPETPQNNPLDSQINTNENIANNLQLALEPSPENYEKELALEEDERQKRREKILEKIHENQEKRLKSIKNDTIVAMPSYLKELPGPEEDPKTETEKLEEQPKDKRVKDQKYLKNNRFAYYLNDEDMDQFNESFMQNEDDFKHQSGQNNFGNVYDFSSNKEPTSSKNTNQKIKFPAFVNFNLFKGKK